MAGPSFIPEIMESFQSLSEICLLPSRVLAVRLFCITEYRFPLSAILGAGKS